MRTKTPFIGALGQFEGLEADWNQANTRNFDYLEYKPVSVDGTLAPPPQRQPPADVPTGFIQMAMLSRDAVKAVTGIYDASLGNRSNEVSGLAIRARQQQGDIGNFHFTDNLTRAITRMAKCLIAMIPRIYDAQRVVRILGEDRKSAEFKPINTPVPVQGEDGRPKVDARGQAITTILNDLTVGTYDVTVSTGPAYNTMREETVANMVEVGGKWPKLFEVAGDKLVSAMDWPGATEIAERIKKSMPPGLVDDEDQDENMVQTPKGPIPAQQAGQLIGQLDQAMEQMQAELDEANSGLAKAKMDNDAKIEVARIQADSRSDVEELKGMIALIMQRIDPALAHQAAVAAAADPDHPAVPADVTLANALPQEEGAEPAPGGAAPPPAPAPEAAWRRRKTIAITAPSGQVYQGEIIDEPGDGEPTA